MERRWMVWPRRRARERKKLRTGSEGVEGEGREGLEGPMMADQGRMEEG